MVSSQNDKFKKVSILILIGLLVLGVWIVKNKSNTEKDIDSIDYALDATDNFDIEKLLSYGVPVMIDFGSDSCIPCKEMEPTLKELNEELEGKAIIKFVDVWKNPDAANGFPLKVIPTQFFFDKEGNPYTPNNNSSNLILYSNKEDGEHIFTAHEGGMEKDEIIKILKEMGLDD